MSSAARCDRLGLRPAEAHGRGCPGLGLALDTSPWNWSLAAVSPSQISRPSELSAASRTKSSARALPGAASRRPAVCPRQVGRIPRRRLFAGSPWSERKTSLSATVYSHRGGSHRVGVA